MNKTKFYKWDRFLRKVTATRSEKVAYYHHHFGITNERLFGLDLEGMEEISEAQYNRVKKIILAKLLNQ